MSTTLSFNSKYASLEALLKDKSYCKWLCQQNWFKSRPEYEVVHIMLNLKTSEPVRADPTPEFSVERLMGRIKVPQFTFGRFKGQSASHKHDERPASFHYTPKPCEMCKYMLWLQKQNLDDEKSAFVNEYFKYMRMIRTIKYRCKNPVEASKKDQLRNKDYFKKQSDSILCGFGGGYVLGRAIELNMRVNEFEKNMNTLLSNSE